MYKHTLIIILLLIGHQGIGQDSEENKFYVWKISFTPNKMLNLGYEFIPNKFNSLQADIYFGNINPMPQLALHSLYHSELRNRLGAGFSYRRYLVPFTKNTLFHPYISFGYTVKRELEKKEVIYGYTTIHLSPDPVSIINIESEKFTQHYFGFSIGSNMVKKIKQRYIIPIDISFGSGILLNVNKKYSLHHNDNERPFSRKVSKDLLDKSVNQEYFPFKSTSTKLNDLLFFQLRIQFGLIQTFSKQK